MSKPFDPYYTWLGIRPEEQPPNHYRLLALQPFEDNLDTIEHAADARMAHLRTLQTGQHSADCQRLLNEVATAKVCLLNPQRKAEYDKTLRSQPAFAGTRVAAGGPVAVPIVGATARPTGTASQAWADPVDAAPVAVVAAQPAGARPSSVPAPVVASEGGARATRPYHRRNNSTLGIALVLLAAVLVLGGLVWALQSGDDQPPTAQAGNGSNHSVAVKTPSPPPTDRPPKNTSAPPKGGPSGSHSTPPAERPRVPKTGDAGQAPPPPRQAGEPAEDTSPDDSASEPTSMKDPSETTSASPDDSPSVAEKPSPDGPGSSDAPIAIPADSAPMTTSAVEDASAGGSDEPTLGDRPPSVLAKKPIPSLSEQQKVLEQIEELYKLSTLKSSAEKLKAAGELAELAKKSGSEAEAFTLRRKAMDLALEGGSLDKACEMIDEIDAEFKIDVLVVKENILTRFVEKASDTERVAAAIRLALDLTDDALHEKRYSLAQSAIGAGHRASQKPTATLDLRKRIAERRTKVQKLYEQWQQVEKARAVLAENPDDAPANLTVGKWKCLVEEDWAGGVPMLARGSDQGLKQAAEQEARGEPAPAEFVRRGDAWYEAAQNRAADEKAAWLRRAAFWYQKVGAESTSALEQEKARKRLAEIAAFQDSLLPPEKSPAKPPPTTAAKPRGGVLSVRDAMKQFGMQPPVWRLDDETLSADAGPRGSGGIYPVLQTPRKMSNLDFRVKMQSRSQTIFVIIDGQRYAYTRGLWRGHGSMIQTPAGENLLPGDAARDEQFASLGVELNDNKLKFSYEGREVWSGTVPGKAGVKRNVAVGFGTSRGELQVRELYLDGE